MKGTDIELMLDSGAYSAWTRGVQIKLEDYIAFILKHRDAWTTVVNLDVIPGKKGGPRPTPAETDRAAEEGWENYTELKKALVPHGITPIHVFHRGEDFRWLKKLVNDCEFFGLGPTTDGTTPQRMAWLDECMLYVTDKDGWPIRKLHGFACTAIEIMESYPWYSVDSASWQWTGRMGGCVIPDFGVVPFSAKSSKRLTFGQHFDTYPRLDREKIAQYLASHGIPDPRMLRDNYCLTCKRPIADRGVYLDHPELMACCSEPQPNIAYIKRDEINIDYVLGVEAAAEMRAWKRS